ncbi:hypothetical protein B0T17DRAFT_507455 [Bombardia bombarda]|uniref:Protein kinase domain-containing protein n=1 Tax=Bombardia bombarda TaxID=252184 RepID=A0AA39XC63_9PEZI|nr:hypothetical protein B0T17DRAFT_507455 [Bombardia bombarda]
MVYPLRKVSDHGIIIHVEHTVPGTGTTYRSIFTATDDKTNQAYVGHYHTKQSELTVKAMNEALKLIPDNDIYPVFSGSGLTAAKVQDANQFQSVEHPKFETYEFNKSEPTGSPAALLLHEAKVHELLRTKPESKAMRLLRLLLYPTSPVTALFSRFLAPHQPCDGHPNIVRYHGVRVRRGYVTGLVVDKHMEDLDSVEVNPLLFKGRLDKEVIMSGLRSAVEHVHAHGLAHNDISPSSVVFSNDGQNRPILTGSGACQKEGEKLLSSDMRQWFVEPMPEADTSSKARDLVALERMERWIDEMLKTMDGEEKRQKKAHKGVGLESSWGPKAVVLHMGWKPVENGGLDDKLELQYTLTTKSSHSTGFEIDKCIFDMR